MTVELFALINYRVKVIKKAAQDFGNNRTSFFSSSYFDFFFVLFRRLMILSSTESNHNFSLCLKREKVKRNDIFSTIFALVNKSHSTLMVEGL